MPWIKTVRPHEAVGLLKKQYDAALRRVGKVYNVVAISSLKPPVLKSKIDLYKSLMLSGGSLSRGQREMLAVVVSKVNSCNY